MWIRFESRVVDAWVQKRQLVGLKVGGWLLFGEGLSGSEPVVLSSSELSISGERLWEM